MLQDWYESHGITLQLNRKVTQINRGRRQVIADDGMVAQYDHAVVVNDTPWAGYTRSWCYASN